MKTFAYPITTHLGKGLRQRQNTRNQPYLVEAIGCFPYEGVLEAVEQFSRVDTSALACSFPYPQIFVLSNCIVVCTLTSLFELVNGSLVTKASNIPPGLTWDVVDFKTFLYLTNGQVAITKNYQTGAYAQDSSLPFGTCLCNFNGQVFIGSPNIKASFTSAGEVLQTEAGIDITTEGGEPIIAFPT